MRRVIEAIVTGCGVGIGIIVTWATCDYLIPGRTDAARTAALRAEEHLMLYRKAVRDVEAQTRTMQKIADAILFAAEKKKEETGS